MSSHGQHHHQQQQQPGERERVLRLASRGERLLSDGWITGESGMSGST